MIKSNDMPVQLMVDINNIKRNPQNYKRHPLSQIDRIAASYERFGQRKPLVVKRQNNETVLIAGEGGLEALHQLAKKDRARWCTAWVTLVPDEWTDEDVIGYLVADNETQRGAEDNNELLADILERQTLSGHDLASLGFSPNDYSELLASIDRNAPVTSTVEQPKDPRLDEFTFGETRQLVFHFDVPTYAKIIERLERIRENHKLETNTEAFTFLLDEYEHENSSAL